MTEAQLSTTIIENPEMLKYQQRQQQQQVEQKNASIREASGTATAAPKVASMVNGESLEDIRKVGVLDSRSIVSRAKSINIKLLMIKSISAWLFMLNGTFQPVNGPVGITGTC